MTQYIYSKVADQKMTINITPGDLSSAANQTASDIKWTLPAGYAVADVYVQNVGGTITSSGTLTNLNATVGVTSTGVGYVAATDLKAAGTVATTIAAGLPGVSTTDVTVYASFTPVGSGSNWSTMTYPVATTATLYTVNIVYRNIAPTAGDSLR